MTPEKRTAWARRLRRSQSGEKRREKARGAAKKASRPGAQKTILGTATSAVDDLWGIGRELVRWPARVWMGAAEVAGAIVLRAWLEIALPTIRFVVRAGRAALAFAERAVTPARGLAVVAVGATLVLGASQFADYRGVEVGASDYAGVEQVAAAPEVDKETARSAHGITVFALAVAALFVTVFAVGRNWRLARLLLFIGAAVVLIALVVDAPQGLREGDAAIAYEGAKATLLGGFWAELFSAATLIFVGPLLAVNLRAERRARRGTGEERPAPHPVMRRLRPRIRGAAT